MHTRIAHTLRGNKTRQGYARKRILKPAGYFPRDDTMNQEFLKPRLDGDRFDEHSIPLELLKDFAALEEMLIEVAKWKFRQSHPDSKRIQRNFSKGLELHLAGVGEGSAVPAIVLTFAGLFPAENVTYFEQARTEIIEAIANAEQGDPQRLPPNLLSYFDRFGRGLREGETMEFSRDGSTVRLNPNVRKQLIRSSQVDVWTEEVALRGKISEADQARRSFELELRDGTKLRAPLNDQHLGVVLDTFHAYRQGACVLIQGVAKKDRQDHLKEFESVEHVSPLDPLDVTLRLEELAMLKGGWLDGKGQAPAPEKLRQLAAQFEANFDADLLLPHLYPTPEGGIQAEWSLGDWEVSLEINLDSQTGEYQALNLADRKTHEHVLALASTDGWKTLNEAIKTIGGAQA